MSVPEDTSRRDPLVHLAGALGGSSRYIEEQEAAGQAQLVNSTVLPIRIQGAPAPPVPRGRFRKAKRPSPEQPFIDLGFTFGEEVDDLFREATLPEGWSRKGSDHAMWSHIVDDTGAERVEVFYKAAWYDREAFMRLVQP